MKRKREAYIVSAVFLLVSGAFLIGCLPGDSRENESPRSEVSLPEPRRTGDMSVEAAIFQRRSIRSFRDEPLAIEEISQLAWAAGGKTVDGVTGATRAYPSAGGIYPLEIYVVAGRVEGLPAGVYRYDWRGHSLGLLKEGDLRERLAGAAMNQRMIARAPASLVLAASVQRTASRYGSRGETRYVSMDAGGAGQNVHLQAEALGLGTVIVGAFNDGEVRSLLGIEQEPFYIMPVGKK